jgi:hypothetical protein
MKEESYKMRYITAALFIILFSVKSFACGDVSDCTAGFSQDSDGHFRVLSTRNPPSSSDYIPMYTGNVIRVSWILKGLTFGVYFPDGRRWMVDVARPELGQYRRITRFPEYVSSPAQPIYTYFMEKEYYQSNGGSSSVPFLKDTLYPSVSQGIVGNLDSVVQTTTGVVVTGWACDKGQNKSIDVHVYAGGPAGKGTIIGHGTSNRESSDKIASLCGGTRVGHRFRVGITQAMVNSHRGQRVYVHGISVSGGANSTISKSGDLRVPNPQVIGYIDSATKVGTQVQIKGWACEEGINKSLRVHVYMNAPAGMNGTILKGGDANLSSEDAVSKECGTTLKKHRFNVAIPFVAQNSGKLIYIHGISVTGSANRTIARSGKIKLP